MLSTEEKRLIIEKAYKDAGVVDSIKSGVTKGVVGGSIIAGSMLGAGHVSSGVTQGNNLNNIIQAKGIVSAAKDVKGILGGRKPSMNPKELLDNYQAQKAYPGVVQNVMNKGTRK